MNLVQAVIHVILWKKIINEPLSDQCQIAAQYEIQRIFYEVSGPSLNFMVKMEAFEPFGPHCFKYKQEFEIEKLESLEYIGKELYVKVKGINTPCRKHYVAPLLIFRL